MHANGVVSRGSAYTQVSRGTTATANAAAAARSRGGTTVRDQRSQQQQPTRISCNRCRKPLVTTIYVCACDCVFCEDCTFSHFNSNSNCPVCNKTLGAKDFLELVIAGPSSIAEDTRKASLQSVMTRYSATGNHLTHQEMTARVLTAIDLNNRAVRFLLKQTMMDGQTSSHQLGNAARLIEQVKQENTQLKQASASANIAREKDVKDLQLRLQALTSANNELQKKSEAKDVQIQQFREIFASGRAPGSSYSNSSHAGGGGPFHRGGTGNTNENQGNSSVSSGRQPVSTFAKRQPVPGFVQLQQAHTSSQARGDPSRPSSGSYQRLQHHGSGGVMRSGAGSVGRSSSDLDSVLTPIAIPPPHQRFQQQHLASPRLGGDGTQRSGVPVYSFSTHSNSKRSRSTSPGPPNSFGYSGSNGSGGGIAAFRR